MFIFHLRSFSLNLLSVTHFEETQIPQRNSLQYRPLPIKIWQLLLVKDLCTGTLCSCFLLSLIFIQHWHWIWSGLFLYITIVMALAQNEKENPRLQLDDYFHLEFMAMPLLLLRHLSSYLLIVDVSFLSNSFMTAYCCITVIFPTFWNSHWSVFHGLDEFVL